MATYILKEQNKQHEYHSFIMQNTKQIHFILVKKLS